MYVCNVCMYVCIYIYIYIQVARVPRVPKLIQQMHMIEEGRLKKRRRGDLGKLAVLAGCVVALAFQLAVLR